jgi:hypothetical protein
VNIATSNGNISFSANGIADQMTILGIAKNSNFTAINFNNGIQVGTSANPERIIAWGNCLLAAASGTAVTIGSTTIADTGLINTSTAPQFNGGFDVNGGTATFLSGTTLNIGLGSLQQGLKTPSSASASGTAGQIRWDANYIYVCTATNTWKRVALSTW